MIDALPESAQANLASVRNAFARWIPKAKPVSADENVIPLKSHLCALCALCALLFRLFA